MESVLRFRHLLTPQGMLHDHALVVDAAGKILRVEKTDGPWDGYLALPGMPNAHSHAFQRAMSGFGERKQGSDSFWSWREAMYKLAAAITPEQMQAVARLAFIEMLLAGYTRVAEFHYLHHMPDASRGQEMAAAVIEAAADTGIGLRFFPVYYCQGGFDRKTESSQTRFVHENTDTFLKYIASLPDCELGIAPHSLRAVPAHALQELVAGASSMLGQDCLFHIHIAEQQVEVEQCLAATGKRPVQLLADSIELSSRWHLVHATHTNETELQIISGSGASVVLCPLTEANLGDGLFDAVSFRNNGGTISIGTDSNCRISVFEEMRMLEYSQRLKNRQRAQLADESGLGNVLWKMLSKGGATACGFACGAIIPGTFADLVVIDETATEKRGHHPENLLDALVINGDSNDVSDVYVSGQRIVHAGQHPLHTEAENRFGSVVRDLFA